MSFNSNSFIIYYSLYHYLTWYMSLFGPFVSGRSTENLLLVVLMDLCSPCLGMWELSKFQAEGLAWTRVPDNGPNVIEPSILRARLQLLELGFLFKPWLDFLSSTWFSEDDLIFRTWLNFTNSPLFVTCYHY